MARPVTLFTAQSAGMPLATLTPVVKDVGYDGLELCTRGDHIEMQKALDADDHVWGRLASGTGCDITPEYPTRLAGYRIWQGTVKGTHDPLRVRLLALQAASRRQQVGNGCFQSVNEGPVTASSQTMAGIMAAASIHHMVRNAKKAQSLHDALSAKARKEFPAFVLRRHPSTPVELDTDSAARSAWMSEGSPADE